MTEDVIDALKRHEGFRSKPYFDTTGHLTIGYGTNLDKGITEEQAEALMQHDVQYIYNQLQRLPWFEHLSNARKGVLVNMAYNLGLNGLYKFTRMIEALEKGDYDAAAVEMMDSKWARQVGNRALDLSRIMSNG